MAPIFKDVNSMLDYDPKGREKLTDQLSRTLSTEDEEASKKLSKEVGQRIHEAVHGNGWMSKAARTARVTDPFYVGRTVSPYGAVVAVGAEIGTRQPATVIAGTFSIAVALFLLCNPHNILSRWISIQTRIICSIDAILLTCSMFSGNERVVLAFLVWSMITGVVSVLMNSRWLFAQNMLRSDTVKKAIVQCADTSAMTRWDDVGKREVRTFALEAGLPFDDQTLEIGYLGPWLCGYYNHHTEIGRKDAEIEKLQAKIDQYEFASRIDEETIDKMQSEIEKLQDSDDLRSARARAMELSNRLAEMKKSNDALKNRVEELESELSIQLEISPEELLRQQIFELRKPDADGNQLSIREIKAELEARGITVSNGKIGTICKEYKDLQEGSTEDMK